MTIAGPIYLGSIKQGLSAEHIYSIKFTDATAASVPSVTVYNRAGDNKTLTVMPAGSPSAATNIVTLPNMKSLALADGVYRVVVVATVDGQRPSRSFDVVPRDEKVTDD